MSEPTPESTDMRERQQSEAVRVAILTEVDSGTYDPETSLAEIAERSGLGMMSARQLLGGMLNRQEIAWEPEGDGSTGFSHLALTEAGKTRLTRFVQGLC